MLILGIESSCDETGVGIIELSDNGHMEIRADVVASSMEQHARFGGVVPEIASRAHLEAMPQVMKAALEEAGVEKPDAVAATVGPGLAGALLVGASAAKALPLRGACLSTVLTTSAGTWPWPTWRARNCRTRWLCSSPVDTRSCLRWRPWANP